VDLTTGNVVRRLLDVYDSGGSIAPLTDDDPAFDLDAAYDVLAEIERVRRADGWTPAGRKIGFTNRTLWEPYGVDAPMWARVWDRTVIDAPDGRAAVSLRFPELRAEPEVVFGLAAPLGPTDDPADVLAATGWIAPGFELVWSPFPGWRFRLPDCTACFGLHGALVVGPRRHLTDDDRTELLEALPAAEVALARDGEIVDRGLGSNVLGGPAHALAHLSRVLAGQPAFDDLAAGEIVTTGTVTDAAYVHPGQTWTSDYGALGLSGVSITVR
jgi:2-oxo-3-hexenedioate decarboxylase